MYNTIVINGKDPFVHRMVFELRYSDGFIYLDRCGQMINELLKQDANWAVDPANPNPQSASLFHIKNQIALTIGVRNIVFQAESAMTDNSMLEANTREEFSTICDSATSLVVDVLKIEDFQRMGFRVWHSFSCNSANEASKWVEQLGIFKISNTLKEEFGDEFESIEYSVLIKGSPDRRISARVRERTTAIDFGTSIVNFDTKRSSDEQKEKLRQRILEKQRVIRNPDYSVIVDIDSSVDNPRFFEAPKIVKQFIDDERITGLQKFGNAVKGKK